jgi:hypothetical protein
MSQPILPSGKVPLISIGWKVGWTPELVWMLFRKEKSLARIKTVIPHPSSPQPISILTDLPIFSLLSLFSKNKK